jgi:hypothetical protein
MKELYLKYLDAWRTAGGQLFMHYLSCYRPSIYGRWGALEHLMQERTQAPKYDALMEFVEKHPRWW